MASLGMPKTTQVASSWAMVAAPASFISSRVETVVNEANYRAMGFEGVLGLDLDDQLDRRLVSRPWAVLLSAMGQVDRDRRR